MEKKATRLINGYGKFKLYMYLLLTEVGCTEHSCSSHFTSCFLIIQWNDSYCVVEYCSTWRSWGLPGEMQSAIVLTC